VTLLTAIPATAYRSEIESPYAWARLLVSLAVSTIGGVALWSTAVVLPLIQAEFGLDRAAASLPYTAVMLGFVAGGPAMGWLADRFGIAVPAAISAVMLSLGLLLSSQAASIWQFTLVHGLLIGIGGSASFGPLIADISMWFSRRRGIAVAIAASGSYLAGTIWPLAIQSLIGSIGWRSTYFGIGVFCLLTMLPLILVLRRRRPALVEPSAASVARDGPALPPGVSPAQLQLLLMLAGAFCCMAMAMPQVHIVAYCVDLGYGSANGAQMLSLMLGTGIISRLGFGWVADRIGPLPTLSGHCRRCCSARRCRQRRCCSIWARTACCRSMP
jgi:MFS family permease